MIDPEYTTFIHDLQILPLNNNFPPDTETLEHGAQLQKAMLHIRHQAIYQKQLDQR
jgi:hypothetical protein